LLAQRPETPAEQELVHHSLQHRANQTSAHRPDLTDDERVARVSMSGSLVLVVCAAPLAQRAQDLAAALTDDGWQVTVVATPSGHGWVDSDRIADIAGWPPLYEHRQPDEPKRGGRPEHVVVCPLTMNTGSKLALGIMDNYALGVLCEALATRTPITAVTMVNDRLWSHPRWSANLKLLQDAGVRFLDARTGRPGDPQAVQSGGGTVSHFDPAWVVAALR
jgi:phosphopantothenoylcysteine decarboxylase